VTEDDDVWDDDEEVIPASPPIRGVPLKDLHVESKTLQQDDEFMYDADEFEGYEVPKVQESGKPVAPTEEILTPDEAIFRPPRTYGLEYSYIGFLLFYAAIYMWGRRENQQIANAWARVVQDIFSSNFSRFGDTEEFLVTKESQSLYTVDCAGRVHCYGAQVTLDLKRRHDLTSHITGLLSPKNDTLTFDVALESSVQPFVFAAIKKREEKQTLKEFKDITQFGTLTNSQISSAFSVYSDTGEPSKILNSEVTNILRTFENYVQLIYCSDQSTITPKYNKILRLVFKLPTRKEMDRILPLMALSFYLIDLIASNPFSKTAMQKTERARFALTLASEKQAHEQRQELAQKRKQDKKQKEDEKFDKLAPEEQRKAEEREYKKKLKQKQPKYKVIMG